MKTEKPKMYIASCSFGKDSLATILVALENGEPLDRVVFSEVMFDHARNISGELPEHIAWIYETAIPELEEMGVKVDVVRAKKDYIALCKQVLQKGKNKGKMYGVQNSKPCYANSTLKLEPIRKYISRFRKDFDVVQYVGIAADEPKRLVRLKGSNKISILAKYGITEEMAMEKCKEYSLVSPCYSMNNRGGCWFCFNSNFQRFVHIRAHYPMYWEAFRTLYKETNSKSFVYSRSLEKVEQEMNALEAVKKLQYKLKLI